MSEPTKNFLAPIIFCLAVFGVLGRLMKIGEGDAPSLEHAGATSAVDRAWTVEQLNILSRYRGDGTIFSASGYQNGDLLILSAPYCDDSMSMLPPQWQEVLHKAKFDTVNCREVTGHDQDAAEVERPRLPASSVREGDPDNRREQWRTGSPRGCRFPM